jgi:hypothetical protein
MNYTKTPWTVTTVPTSSGICHRIGSFPSKRPEFNDGKTHACVYVDYPSGRSNPIEVELAANAALMAAAPDLYEALEAVSKFAVEMELQTYSHFPAMQVLAALAKAKKEII